MPSSLQGSLLQAREAGVGRKDWGAATQASGGGHGAGQSQVLMHSSPEHTHVHTHLGTGLSFGVMECSGFDADGGSTIR